MDAGFSQWRYLKRLVLIVLLALVLGAILGCQGSKNERPRSASFWRTVGLFVGIWGQEEETVPELKGLSQYTGAGNCVFCHAANYYVWKLTTKHGEAFHGLVDEKSESKQECLPCHTAGFGCSPCHIVGGDKRLFRGVQCENCHGPGSNHAKGLVRMPKPNLSAEACKCHGERHSAILGEWKRSKHAFSLSDLKNSKEEKPEEKCLHCMSVDFIVSKGKVTLETAREPVTCLVCHDPHNNKYGYQLRKPKEEICNPCHAADEGVPAQQEMLTGIGGKAGTPFGRGHGAVRGVDCVTCHMHKREPLKKNEPHVSGHSFEPNVEECNRCHSDGQRLWEETQTAIKGSLAVLEAKLDTVDPSKLDAEKKKIYEEAKFDYDFIKNEGSFGIHNKPYADSLIRVVEDRLGQLK